MRWIRAPPYGDRLGELGLLTLEKGRFCADPTAPTRVWRGYREAQEGKVIRRWSDRQAMGSNCQRVVFDWILGRNPSL